MGQKLNRKQRRLLKFGKPQSALAATSTTSPAAATAQTGEPAATAPQAGKPAAATSAAVASVQAESISALPDVASQVLTNAAPDEALVQAWMQKLRAAAGEKSAAPAPEAPNTPDPAPATPEVPPNDPETGSPEPNSTDNSAQPRLPFRERFGSPIPPPGPVDPLALLRFFRKTKRSGPITDEGKARSSQNSFKHGLTSRFSSFKLIPGEDAREYQQLVSEIQSQFAPRTYCERAKIEDMAQAWWLQRRARTLQSHAFEDGDTKAFALFMRYETTQRRSYQMAYKDFQDMKKARIAEQSNPDTTPYQESAAFQSALVATAPQEPTAPEPQPQAQPDSPPRAA